MNNNNDNNQEEEPLAIEVAGCFGELFSVFVIAVIIWGIYLFIKA